MLGTSTRIVRGALYGSTPTGIAAVYGTTMMHDTRLWLVVTTTSCGNHGAAPSFGTRVLLAPVRPAGPGKPPSRGTVTPSLSESRRKPEGLGPVVY